MTDAEVTLARDTDVIVTEYDLPDGTGFAYLKDLATLAVDLIECHAALDAADDLAEVDR